MRLSRNKLIGLFIFSIILGFVAQNIYISDASDDVGAYNKIGFTILIPFFVALFIWFLELTNLKNKSLIISLSTVLFFLIFLLNFLLYSLTGGPTSETEKIKFALVPLLEFEGKQI